MYVWHMVLNNTNLSPLSLSAGLQQCPYWAKYGKPRLIIYTVINSKYFDLAIAGVIGLNVITMAMEFYMMPQVRTLYSRWEHMYLINPLNVHWRLENAN